MLNELKDNQGATKGRMRIARGIGSGKGKTGGRGGKGQTARSGVRIKGFEGGQMPIHRRLPKRGFNQHHRVEYAVVNVCDIQKAVDAGKIDAAKTIDIHVLADAGLVRKNDVLVKLLAKGGIKAKMLIEVVKASKSAIETVEKLGGKVTVLV